MRVSPHTEPYHTVNAYTFTTAPLSVSTVSEPRRQVATVSLDIALSVTFGFICFCSVQRSCTLRFQNKWNTLYIILLYIGSQSTNTP